ncbi:MAG: hypothetical protein B7C54_01840 [Acidimicrobiales bacterium mtb01]|nr:hypothetical protein [Actinomycetota bacterium]TEX47829.1 MAG: hypothetical protein B7C54_01840 [Acidimicrobiales bacterium mtb01]
MSLPTPRLRSDHPSCDTDSSSAGSSPEWRRAASRTIHPSNLRSAGTSVFQAIAEGLAAVTPPVLDTHLADTPTRELLLAAASYEAWLAHWPVEGDFADLFDWAEWFEIEFVVGAFVAGTHGSSPRSRVSAGATAVVVIPSSPMISGFGRIA